MKLKTNEPQTLVINLKSSRAKWAVLMVNPLTCQKPESHTLAPRNDCKAEGNVNAQSVNKTFQMFSGLLLETSKVWMVFEDLGKCQKYPSIRAKFTVLV